MPNDSTSSGSNPPVNAAPTLDRDGNPDSGLPGWAVDYLQSHDPIVLDRLTRHRRNTLAAMAADPDFNGSPPTSEVADVPAGWRLQVEGVSPVNELVDLTLEYWDDTRGLHGAIGHNFGLFVSRLPLHDGWGPRGDAAPYGPIAASSLPDVDSVLDHGERMRATYRRMKEAQAAHVRAIPPEYQSLALSMMLAVTTWMHDGAVMYGLNLNEGADVLEQLDIDRAMDVGARALRQADLPPDERQFEDAPLRRWRGRLECLLDQLDLFSDAAGGEGGQAEEGGSSDLLTAEGGPYKSAEYFRKEWSIPDGRLRKAKYDGDLRAILLRKRNYYSMPDVRGLWPEDAPDSA